ncbi:MAG: hypothetical protein GW886_08805 [Rhodobacterales bacterium]|nr:hypothetical protein [Rhodobacterales bacterium]NCT12418.1 hypothetical protein [Rhodobacterales bacterium]
MRSYRIAGALASCLGLAVPALAQQTFTPPQGCTGTLTVQGRACLVTHVWTCEGDAPGEQWLALSGEAGPFMVRRIDTEFQWLETYYADPPRVETMTQPAPNPGSITTLLAEGYDSFDFTVTFDDGSPAERIVGHDKLTGEEVVIDGERLLRTEFAYDVIGPDGTVLQQREGRQYISPTQRLFHFGTDWDKATPADISDASPVQFIYPGEPGFFAASPKYDCGVVMSKQGVAP